MSVSAVNFLQKCCIISIVCECLLGHFFNLFGDNLRRKIPEVLMGKPQGKNRVWRKGVAGFLTPEASKRTGSPWEKLLLKNHIFCIEFLYLWLSNFKFGDRENNFFLFKMFASLPLESSARGGSTNRPSLATPLLCRPRLRCEDNIRIDLTEIGR